MAAGAGRGGARARSGYLSVNFRITRDGYGVPHVRAETAAGAWAGMGYACAQDRLFQMDYDRRRACGRWAEIAGSGRARRATCSPGGSGSPPPPQRDVAAMSPPLRAAFEAYADGVNQAIADGARPLPGRYPAEPWQPWHSVAAFLVRHVPMGQWQHKLANAVLLARAGAGAFERLETRPVPGSPVAVPPDGRLTHPVGRLLDEALGDIEGHLGFLAEVEPGSNAWAVSGRRTAHGARGDLQRLAPGARHAQRVLAVPGQLPRLRRQRGHLPRAARVSRTSASTARSPGRSPTGTPTPRTCTWSSSQGTRYLTPDGWQEAEVSARADRGARRLPGHRPGLGDQARAGRARQPGNRARPGAASWTGTHRANRGLECLLPMLTARSAAELAAAQDGWVDPVNNLVCADTGGQIAYQCRGELPVRSSDAGRRLPVAGLGRLVRVDRDGAVRRACPRPPTPRPGS